MHSYVTTFGYIQSYANTDVGVFWIKCVKLASFFYFGMIDAVALIVGKCLGLCLVQDFKDYVQIRTL